MKHINSATYSAALITGLLMQSSLTMAVPITGPEFYTDFDPSPSAWEPDIDELMASLEPDLDLTRVSDHLDQLWELTPDNPELAAIRARARYAGYNSTVGVLPGASGDEFVELFMINDVNPADATHPNRWQTDETEWLYLQQFDLAGDFFRLGLLVPTGNIFSSLSSDNSDGRDHVITWIDDADPYHYFVGFEDIMGGGDNDFNDVILELRFVIDGVIDGNAPLPSSLALFALGMAGLGYSQARRSKSHA